MPKTKDLISYINNGKVPPAFIDSVRLAIKSTFKSIFNAVPRYHDVDEGAMPSKGIVGVISFVGDISWSMSMGLPKQMAAAMSQTFVGMDIDFDSDDMGDMIGEFVNIIGGDVVSKLDSFGIKVDMSLPTVTKGYDLKLLYTEDLPTEKMFFTHEDDDFWVKIAIDNRIEELASQKSERNKKITPENDERLKMNKMNEQELAAAYLNCVKQAILTTFQAMYDEQPKFKGVTKDSNAISGVVSIISFVAVARSWSLMMGFSKDMAVKFGTKFAGFDIDYESEDMTDVIGEIVNVVGGDVVSRLDGIGIKTDLSIPTIAKGSEMQMLMSTNISAVQMDYTMNLGEFWIKLASSVKQD